MIAEKRREEKRSKMELEPEKGQDSSRAMATVQYKLSAFECSGRACFSVCARCRSEVSAPIRAASSLRAARSRFSSGDQNVRIECIQA